MTAVESPVAILRAPPPARVLHVHSGNMLGGVESMLLEHAAAAGRSPLLIEFALCFDGAFRRRVEATGARIALLGAPRLSRPHRLWRARRALASLLERCDPGVAVVHSGWTQALFAPVFERSGVPWVRWHHAPLRRDQLLERAALRHTPSLVICNSTFTARQSAWAYPRTPPQVLYCPAPGPAPPGDRGDLRRELETGDADVVLAMVGRFEPLKGHDVLLKALARLRDDRRWTCWIVGAPQSSGEAAWLDALRKLAADLGITTRLRFTGLRSDVPSLLRAADIYCQPNTGPEGFGLSLVEGLAAGLPIVTTAIGAAEEIVTAGAGLLVTPGDDGALAKALGELLAAPERRAHLGACAGARAAAFPGIDAHLREFAGLLATLSRAAAAHGE